MVFIAARIGDCCLKAHTQANWSSFMCRNCSQMLGCFDEMSSFYGWLKLYNSSFTFLQSVSCFLMILLFQCHQTLLTFSKSSASLQTIINDKYSTLQKVMHTQPTVTSKLLWQKLNSGHKNAQGILPKARGYCARIAMVIHCLEQALQLLDSTNTTVWNNISLEAVQAATIVIMHFIQQKFFMLGIDGESFTTNVLSIHIMCLLTTSSKNGTGILTPSLVSQKHISVVATQHHRNFGRG